MKVANFTGNRRAISQTGRLAIAAAWGNKCAYCEKPVDTFEIDHIVAHSKGGTCELENLCISCRDCNLKKGASALPKFYEGLLLSLAARRAKKVRRRLAVSRVRLPSRPNCAASAVFGTAYVTKYHNPRARGNTHRVTQQHIDSYLNTVVMATQRGNTQ